jgi:hypothetical protein
LVRVEWRCFLFYVLLLLKAPYTTVPPIHTLYIKIILIYCLRAMFHRPKSTVRGTCLSFLYFNILMVLDKEVLMILLSSKKNCRWGHWIFQFTQSF